MAKFCSKCGNELKEGARFCSVCGNPVKQVQSAQSEATAGTNEERQGVSSQQAGIYCPGYAVSADGRYLLHQ